MAVLVSLAVAGFLGWQLWNWGRWSHFDCWCCGGTGKHKRKRKTFFLGRTLRKDCRLCGGRGGWSRRGARTKAKRR